MKLKLLVIVMIILGTGVYSFLHMTEPSVEKAVSKEIAETGYDRSKDPYELVEVPDSDYYLAIYNDPNQMLVMNVRSLWGGYIASIDSGMNLYEHIKKGSDHFYNNKLTFGTVEIPEGKTATIDGEPVTTLALGEYFKSIKFHADYENLYFYHLKTPKEVSAGMFETVVEVK
ncbi:hypothetical protein ACTWQL_12780 [Pseudalkalibacillus sp. R45]|uniref:hypothetical protein n=1 Tax=Pseudalkalibacillus sp. R45 TaxID=3457433 RepID=UPI003FCE334B